MIEIVNRSNRRKSPGIIPSGNVLAFPTAGSSGSTSVEWDFYDAVFTPKPFNGVLSLADVTALKVDGFSPIAITFQWPATGVIALTYPLTVFSNDPFSIDSGVNINFFGDRITYPQNGVCF